MEQEKYNELSEEELGGVTAGGANDTHYKTAAQVNYRYAIGTTVNYRYNSRNCKAVIRNRGTINDGMGYIATYMLSDGNNITESRILKIG